MMRVALLLMMLIGATGCPPLVVPVYTQPEMEVSRYPTVLYTRSDEWPSMKLYGVGFSSTDADLPRKKVRNRNDAGWVEMRNGARYLIQDGQVKALGVWDERLLSKLQVKSPADIELKFGKPESIDDLGKEVIYRFRGGHIHVMWNEFERRVTTVNVFGQPTALP